MADRQVTVKVDLQAQGNLQQTLENQAKSADKLKAALAAGAPNGGTPSPLAQLVGQNAQQASQRVQRIANVASQASNIAGAAGGPVASVANSAASAVGAFATGGPLLGGLAVAGIAVGALVSAIDSLGESSEEAKKNIERAEQAMDALGRLRGGGAPTAQDFQFLRPEQRQEIMRLGALPADQRASALTEYATQQLPGARASLAAERAQQPFLQQLRVNEALEGLQGQGYHRFRAENRNEAIRGALGTMATDPYGIATSQRFGDLRGASDTPQRRQQILNEVARPSNEAAAGVRILQNIADTGVLGQAGPQTRTGLVSQEAGGLRDLLMQEITGRDTTEAVDDMQRTMEQGFQRVIDVIREGRPQRDP